MPWKVKTTMEQKIENIIRISLHGR